MKISLLAQQLINAYQRGFPLCSRPFLQLAKQFEVSEQAVLSCLEQLLDSGVLSRLGVVFDHKQAGASTLVALSVTDDELDNVAHVVNQFRGVNHNYVREHHYNLWFVVTAPNADSLQQILTAIEQASQCELLVLPMEKSFHIDLAFPIDFARHSDDFAVLELATKSADTKEIA